MPSSTGCASETKEEESASFQEIKLASVRQLMALTGRSLHRVVWSAIEVKEDASWMRKDIACRSPPSQRLEHHFLRLDATVRSSYAVSLEISVECVRMNWAILTTSRSRLSSLAGRRLVPVSSHQSGTRCFSIGKLQKFARTDPTVFGSHVRGCAQDYCPGTSKGADQRRRDQTAFWSCSNVLLAAELMASKVCRTTFAHNWQSSFVCTLVATT